MSTLRVNTLQDAAGTGQPYMPGTAKAWVSFNGTGTVAIRAAFNVGSITDLGVGYYRVNFSTAMADTNYAVSGSVLWNVAGWYWSMYLRNISTGSCEVISADNTTLYDSTAISVVVMR